MSIVVSGQDARSVSTNFPGFNDSAGAALIDAEAWAGRSALTTATLCATGIAAPVEFNRQGKGFWAAKSRVGVHVGGSMYSFFV